MRPGVSSLIIGARTPDQLHSNLAALDISFTADQLTALEQASAQEPAFPYAAFNSDIKRTIFGGTDVKEWRA